MLSEKVVQSYNDSEVFDFEYKLMEKDLEKFESHLRHLSVYHHASRRILVGPELIERFERIGSLFGRLVGKNGSEGYQDFYEYKELMPNDLVRIMLREENDDMKKIIMKDSFSRKKVDTLNELDFLFESGDFELHQLDVDYEIQTEDSIDELRQLLSSLPVSLADIVEQERQGSN